MCSYSSTTYNKNRLIDTKIRTKRANSIKKSSQLLKSCCQYCVSKRICSFNFLRLFINFYQNAIFMSNRTLLPVLFPVLLYKMDFVNLFSDTGYFFFSAKKSLLIMDSVICALNNNMCDGSVNSFLHIVE